MADLGGSGSNRKATLSLSSLAASFGEGGVAGREGKEASDVGL